MAFVVAHTEKYSMGACAGLGIHVDRKSNEHSNKNIDNDLSCENVELVENYKNNLYGAVKDRIKEGYKKQKAIRKDAVATVGVVCSASSDFFKDKTKDESIQYFKDCKEYFESKIGKENIVCAKIHFDEKTPHMHLYFVPLTNDGRLSAKEICNRNFLRDMQRELPSYLQDKGHNVERGLKDSTNEHISKKEYEINLQKMEIEKQIQDLIMQKNKLEEEEKEIEKKKKKFKLEEEKLYNLENINEHIKEKKKLLSNESVVSMDKNLYKSLMKYAVEGEGFARELNNLELSSKMLQESNSKYISQNRILADENNKLSVENIKLKEEISKHKQNADSLEKNLQELGYSNAFEECLLYQEYKNSKRGKQYEIGMRIKNKMPTERNKAEQKIMEKFEKVEKWLNVKKDFGIER